MYVSVDMDRADAQYLVTLPRGGALVVSASGLLRILEDGRAVRVTRFTDSDQDVPARRGYVAK